MAGVKSGFRSLSNFDRKVYVLNFALLGWYLAGKKLLAKYVMKPFIINVKLANLHASVRTIVFAEKTAAAAAVAS